MNEVLVVDLNSCKETKEYTCASVPSLAHIVTTLKNIIKFLIYYIVVKPMFYWMPSVHFPSTRLLLILAIICCQKFRILSIRHACYSLQGTTGSIYLVSFVLYWPSSEKLDHSFEGWFPYILYCRRSSRA